MKIISLSLLSIVLSVSLFARLNPFEPTDHFIEQKDIIIKANQEKKDLIALKIKAKELAKQEDIRMAKIKAENEAKEIAENEVKKIASKKVIIPELKENFKVLPFVEIYVVNNLLTIKVDTKYKFFHQDILKPTKKFLFDFKGNISFYTVRKNIISESFKSFAVGTHREKNFFRVVIDLPDDVKEYEKKVDSKNGIITIRKK